MRFFLFLIPCAVVGYISLPHLNGMNNEEKSSLLVPKIQISFLNSVPKDDIVGSWVLTPRSTNIISHSQGTTGRRTGFSLESWGGGHARLTIDDKKVDGPIAWHSKPGIGISPAKLHISTATNEKLELRFSKLNDRVCLVVEADSIVPGKTDYLRFVKAN